VAAAFIGRGPDTNNQHEGFSKLTIYTILTGDRAVAITNDESYVTRLNSDKLLRDTVRHLKRGDVPLWNGTSVFTARAATPAESEDFKRWQAAGDGLSTMTLPACFEHRAAG
jgi:hypothetical protein